MTAAKIQILPLRRAHTPSSSSSDDSTSSQPHDSGEELHTTKQKRTSKPKVRSGCITCKIRRVKCDETKPACDRCTSTGRKCDGYNIPPRKKRTSPSAIKALQLTTDVAPAELRALGFFHQKTAPALASYFDADFWTKLVFQMSYVEPAVRHATAALGALHEQREMNMRADPVLPASANQAEQSGNDALKAYNDEHEQFALIQYGKAISHLSERLKGDSSIEVALLACILFVCVEFLRGDRDPVVQHFQSGMSIAISLMSNKDLHMTQDTRTRIKEYMMPFLNRIELLSSLFGNDASWEYPVPLFKAVPEDFNSIKEARDSFIHLANLTVRFIRYMKFRRYSRLVLPDDRARQSALHSQLEAWTAAFDRMLLANTITAKELDAVKTLRMHQIIATHWIQRSTEPEECANDKMMDMFDTAVSLVEGTTVSREREMSSDTPTFLFDMEVVSPLYYVAANCRHPLIRRRSIALLKQMHRREGLWDSNKAAAVAERIMHHEEARLINLDGSELPAEVDRIHYANIESEIGTNPKHHSVTFHTKPKGIDGPWKIWKEDIILPGNQHFTVNAGLRTSDTCRSNSWPDAESL